MFLFTTCSISWHSCTPLLGRHTHTHRLFRIPISFPPRLVGDDSITLVAGAFEMFLVATGGVMAEMSYAFYGSSAIGQVVEAFVVLVQSKNAD
jgi:hypothetical protein